MSFVLSDSTFNQLAEFIKEKTGIHIPPTKKYLIENRLFKTLEDYNLKGYDEYLFLLKYSSNGREVNRLFDAITTNETFFFREPLRIFVRGVFREDRRLFPVLLADFGVYEVAQNADHHDYQADPKGDAYCYDYLRQFIFDFLSSPYLLFGLNHLELPSISLEIFSAL